MLYLKVETTFPLTFSSVTSVAIPATSVPLPAAWLLTRYTLRPMKRAPCDARRVLLLSTGTLLVRGKRAYCRQRNT